MVEEIGKRLLLIIIRRRIGQCARFGNQWLWHSILQRVRMWWRSANQRSVVRISAYLDNRSRQRSTIAMHSSTTAIVWVGSPFAGGF
jgi:hypothetical protein